MKLCLQLSVHVRRQSAEASSSHAGRLNYLKIRARGGVTDARSAAAQASASMGEIVAYARSAAAQASASMGGSVADARSAAAQASASMGGCVANAKSAAAHASASMGGGVTDARSAAAQASASMGGIVAYAKSAADQHLRAWAAASRMQGVRRLRRLRVRAEAGWL